MMMNNKFMENIGLKIAALIFAVVLWLIVVNVDDPVKTVTYRNIPVTIENTEIVTNRGKTYKVVDDTQTVNVVVSAKRSDISRITSDKIVATADMSEMQLESLVPIKVSIPGFAGEYTATASPGNLKVKIEERTKKVFPITVALTGTPRDGYVVDKDKALAIPEKIEVKGSESLVSSIETVIARVDVSGISKDEVLPAEIIFYDSNGIVVNRSQLTDNIGEEGIAVDVKVLNVKTVSIRADLNAAGEGNTIYNVTCEPSSIQVCGEEEIINDFNEIVIPSEDIDYNGEEGKLETTIDISTYLPEGISLLDSKGNNVVLTVVVEKEGTRTVEFQVESIKIENLSDKLKVSFEGETEILLQFTGPQEELDKLNLKEIVSIDMKNNINPGEYEVPVIVDLEESSGIVLTETPYIKVKLTEKKKGLDIKSKIKGE